MKILQQEAGEWELLPEDVYEAEVVSITDKPTKYGEALNWEFILLDEGVEDRKAWGMTSKNLVPLDRCKLYAWAKTIGIELQEGEDLDTDDILGRPCRVLTENYEGTDGITRSRVKEVLASKRKQESVKLASKKELQLLGQAFASVEIETAQEKVEYLKKIGIKNKPNKLDSKDVAQILRAIESDKVKQEDEKLDEECPF